MINRTLLLLSLVSLVLMVLFAVSIVLGQDLWRSKSYLKWTKEDIIKIISDSPWAQVREVEADTTNTGGLPNVTIRLRSARPIREALVRLRQIEEHYDQMDEKMQSELDQRVIGTLRCPACDENYVVTISPPISDRKLTNGVYGLKNATLELLKGKVYLINDRGEKRELVFFVAPKHDLDEAVFFFPRRDREGRPLLSEENSKFTFVFEANNIPIVGGRSTTTRRIVTDGTTPVEDTDTVGTITKGRTVPRQVTFDVSKLLINGKVEF
jgi:hypothetical protein